MEDKYKYIFILFISMCILNFLPPLKAVHSENITNQPQSASPLPAVDPRLDGPLFRDPQLRGDLDFGRRGGDVVDAAPFGGDSKAAQLRCECISKIIDGLYLGDIRCASNLQILQEHKIKYILNVTDDIPFFFKNNFEYARIPIKDNPAVNISFFFNHSSSYIENRIRDGNIFIHCYAGISRSSSIVIAYLIIKKKYSYKDAYNLVKSKRPCIRPNKGFDYLLQTHTATDLRSSRNGGTYGLQR
jgi:hypothetical protein